MFASAAPDRPVIYLNTYGREGKQVFKHLQETGCPDFSLVAVSNLEWDHDMAPWDIPPISEKDTPCTGGSDDYLKLLLNQILPEAEKALPGIPSWRGIAGYSLAGLFAVYSIYQTDIFSRVAQYVRFPVVSGNQRLHRFPHAFEKAGLYVLFAG